MSFRNYRGGIVSKNDWNRVFCQRLMGLKTFLFWNTYWGRHDEQFTHAKTFHRVFTAVVRDRITSRLIYYNKIFCTMLFSINVQWNFSIKLMKVLVTCLNASSLKSVLRCVRTTCVNTVWHSESSSAVTLLLHADWMMVKNVSNQGGANSVTAAPCCSLVVSTWIFNGSLIEYHKKKHQPFCLFGVRFGSWAIRISGWKSAWRWSSLVTVNAKPTNSLKFSILGRKSFVTSKQFKWKA